MDYLTENFPLIAAILIIINIFKTPIGKAIGANIPPLVSAWFEDKIDKREHVQELDTLVLKEKLRSSEFEQHQYASREKEYIKLLKQMVGFSQEVLTKQITGTETKILDELKSIKKILSRMAIEET